MRNSADGADSLKLCWQQQINTM